MTAPPTGPEATPLKGSCHCGKVTFEVTGEPGVALACNCSICSRKGALLWAVSRDQLCMLGGDGALSTYTFNQHSIRHRFCSTCGMHPFSEGADHDGNPLTVINLRCLEGIDPESLAVQHFDGRSL